MNNQSDHYRVRRGLNDTCVVQIQDDIPDESPGTWVVRWRDLIFSEAPPFLSATSVHGETRLYRIRKGVFGRSVLQSLIDSPSLINGFPDATIRMIYWCDVGFKNGPINMKRSD